MREADGMPLPEQAAALIAALADAIRRDEAIALRDGPLTPPQYAIARTLSEAGPLMLSELARRSCCVPANVTGLVDRLERKGLARRLADPSDRRVTRVALTAAGDQALAATIVRAAGHPGPLETSLPDQDLRALVDLLGRLCAALPGTAMQRRPA